MDPVLLEKWRHLARHKVVERVSWVGGAAWGIFRILIEGVRRKERGCEEREHEDFSISCTGKLDWYSRRHKTAEWRS